MPFDESGFDVDRRARVAGIMRHGSRGNEILEEFVSTLRRLNISLCNSDMSFETSEAMGSCHLAINDARMLVLEYDNERPIR